jgi:hypothetical protein
MVNLFYGFERWFVWILLCATAGALIRRGYLFRLYRTRTQAARRAIRDELSSRLVSDVQRNPRDALKHVQQLDTGAQASRGAPLTDMLHAALDTIRGVTDRNIARVAEFTSKQLKASVSASNP